VAGFAGFGFGWFGVVFLFCLLLGGCLAQQLLWFVVLSAFFLGSIG
jgi:hypothetical protein